MKKLLSHLPATTLCLFVVYSMCSGCVGIKHQYHNKAIRLTSNNLTAINGYYEDCPETDTPKQYRHLLWSQAGAGNYSTGRNDSVSGQKTGTRGNYQVKLEVVNMHKVIVKLFSEGQQIKKSKVLHGKIVKDCFQSRRFMVIPFFPLAFAYMGESVSIGLKDEGIFVNSHSKSWGVFFGFGGSDNTYCSTTHAKLK